MWAGLPLGRSIHPRWARGCGSRPNELFQRVCQRPVTVERGWRGILSLGGVKVDGLRIWLCRYGGTAGNIDVGS